MSILKSKIASIRASFLALSLMLYSGLVSATPSVTPGIDVDAAVDYVNTEVLPAIAAVGVILIIAGAVVMGFRWVKAMFF